MSQLWDELVTVLGTHAPTIAKTINAPLTSKGVEFLEERQSNSAVVESYRRCNGADYRRVARGGGIMALLPTSDDAPWTGATRWLAHEESVRETERLAGRVSLAAGWLVIGRLYEPWKRSNEYNTEEQRVIIAAADGELFASVDWPETTESATEEPARLRSLGVSWEHYIEKLVCEFRDGNYADELDGTGTSGFLRIVRVKKTKNRVATTPAESFLALMHEHR